MDKVTTQTNVNIAFNAFTDNLRPCASPHFHTSPSIVSTSALQPTLHFHSSKYKTSATHSRHLALLSSSIYSCFDRLSYKFVPFDHSSKSTQRFEAYFLQMMESYSCTWCKITFSTATGWRYYGQLLKYENFPSFFWCVRCSPLLPNTSCWSARVIGVGHLEYSGVRQQQHQGIYVFAGNGAAARQNQY